MTANLEAKILDNIEDNNPEFEREAYDNYRELYKLGVRIVGNLSVEKYFYGLSKTNKYRLEESFKKLEVTLVPHFHSKRAVQEYGKLHTPLVEQYSLNKLVTTTANDLLEENFNANIANVLADRNSYIEIYKDPVNCYFYDVYVSLAHAWDRFKITIKDGKVIHLYPRYVASKPVTLEGFLAKTPSLTEEQKDIMRRDIQITKNYK